MNHLLTILFSFRTPFWKTHKNTKILGPRRETNDKNYTVLGSLYGALVKYCLPGLKSCCQEPGGMCVVHSRQRDSK